MDWQIDGQMDRCTQKDRQIVDRQNDRENDRKREQHRGGERD